MKMSHRESGNVWVYNDHGTRHSPPNFEVPAIRVKTPVPNSFSMSSSTGGGRDKPVESPFHPIAIRAEHIAKETTRLYLRPKADPNSATDYLIKDDVTGETVFSITGPKHGSESGREFRDSSGLPLFQLTHSFSVWKWRWRVRLPGSKDDLAEVKKRQSGNFDVIFRNLATSELKKEADETFSLEARSTTPIFLLTFEVLAAGRKIVDVRESVERNRTIGHMPTYSVNGQTSFPPRRVLDICVAEGVDLSIVRNHRWQVF